jgi:hypothetical protein
VTLDVTFAVDCHGSTLFGLWREREIRASEAVWTLPPPSASEGKSLRSNRLRCRKSLWFVLMFKVLEALETIPRSGRNGR